MDETRSEMRVQPGATNRETIVSLSLQVGPIGMPPTDGGSRVRWVLYVLTKLWWYLLNFFVANPFQVRSSGLYQVVYRLTLTN